MRAQSTLLGENKHGVNMLGEHIWQQQQQQQSSRAAEQQQGPKCILVVSQKHQNFDSPFFLDGMQIVPFFKKSRAEGSTAAVAEGSSRWDEGPGPTPDDLFTGIFESYPPNIRNLHKRTNIYIKYST